MVFRDIYEARQRQSLDRLALKIRRNYNLLDLRDLTASWPGYLEASGYSVRTEWHVSTADALLYLFEKMLEANAPPGKPLHAPVFDHRHVAAFLYQTGPKRLAELRKAGWEEQAAFLSGARAAMLASRTHVKSRTQRALRDAAEGAEDYDGRELVPGYKRIARPTACGFCLMLAGATEKIGLVYNVTERWRTPHPNCECQLEPQPVYRLMHVPSPEQLALTAQMYDALRRERDDALLEAQQDLIAA